MAQANVAYKGEEKKFAINIEAAGFNIDTDDFELEISTSKAGDSVSVLKSGEPNEQGVWTNDDGSLVVFCEETQAQNAEDIVADVSGYSGSASGYVLVEDSPDIYYYDDNEGTTTVHHQADKGDVYYVNGDGHYYRFNGSTWTDLGETPVTKKDWWGIVDTSFFTNVGDLKAIATAYIIDAKSYDGVRKCIDIKTLLTLKNK